MKLISWNVNGLRSCMGKGFVDFVNQVEADVVCVQETKMQPGQAEVPLEGYRAYWNSAERKGYSGTAVFSRLEPLTVTMGIGAAEYDSEGRAITLEYEDFYLVNIYTPNAQHGLTRLDYRMEWEDLFRAYVGALKEKKPVVICGDMNVAHQEIDLKNAKANRGNAGFTDEEREKMTELLDSGFVDSFRLLYPELTEAYSWWSYRFQARERNIGWRIDYFLVSCNWKDCIAGAAIHSEVAGSDHCPVELTLAYGEENEWRRPEPSREKEAAFRA